MSALIIAIIASVTAIASAIFAGISLRMSAKQTSLQTKQYEVLASSTELQFNLNVMMQLDEVLLRIADDASSYNTIWGDLPDAKRPQVAGDTLLDVITMALKACNRLPHFQSNAEDWSSYAEYVMTNSPALRTRVLANPEWWAEAFHFARKAHEIDTQNDGQLADG